MNANLPRRTSLASRLFPRLAAAFAVFSLVAGSGANLPAQDSQTGALRGKVYNPGTGNYLEGAAVSIVGTNQIQLTDRLGQYLFASVPPGEVTLKASYPGLAESTVRAAVRTAERITVADIGLGSAPDSIVKLDDFVVHGEREGQAKAIVMERDAPNVVTLVATDAYGNVGSNSVGNLLQYLPGLTTEGFDGEAFSVSVRGMDSSYGSVTTDGAKLASTNEGGGLSRSTYVLDIGLVNFSEIEVIKAPTPDKAADSTGGVINLRTRSVFSTKAPRSGRLSIGGGTTLKAGMRFKEPHPSFSLNFRQLLGRDDPKFGFTVNASSTARYLPRDQTNLNYEQTFATANPAFPYVNSVTKQLGHQEVTRRSVGGRLEYRPTSTSLLSLGATFNYHHRFNDAQNRTWASTNNTIGTPVLPANFAAGGLYTGTVGIAAGYTANEVFWPRAQVTYGSQVYAQDSNQLALRFAGEHNLGKWKVDYDANYSDYDILQRQSGDWPGGFGGAASLAIQNIGLRVAGFQDSHYYHLEQVGGRNPQDLTGRSSFTFDDWNANKSHTEVSSGTLNVTRLLDFAAAPTTLKAGLNYRTQLQDALPTRYNRYTYIGPLAAITTARFGGTSPLAGDIPRNPLERGMPLFFASIIDASAIRADVQKNPQDWSAPVANAAGNINRGYTEDISAAYLTGTTRLFQRQLTLLGGLRFERTDVEARNNLARDPFTNAPQYTQRKHYTDSFPSLHATWRHSSGLQARASYSTSIGRPNPGSIIPNTTITTINDQDDQTPPGRLNVVNTGLKPRYTDNYEIELEYYLKQGGKLSVGAFRKDMSSFVESTTVILGPDNEFGETYTGWELNTQKNGGSGQVEGVEFDYQSPPLGRFARFLQGVSVFANFTSLRASGQYSDGGSRTLTGFIPRSGNVGVNYSRSGTSVRVRANFRGEYLRFADANPAMERWEYDQTKVDLNFEQRIRRNLSLYVDVINVFNTKGRRFRGTPELGRRRHWADNNGPELYAGVNTVF